MISFLSLIERTWTWIVVLATLSIFFGFLLWLGYLFFGPFFGPNPVGHLMSIVKSVGFGLLVAGAITALLAAGMHAYQRWRPVRLTMRFIAYLLGALLVISSLSRCVGDGGFECLPSRYIDC